MCVCKKVKDVWRFYRFSLINMRWRGVKEDVSVILIDILLIKEYICLKGGTIDGETIKSLLVAKKEDEA